MMGERLNCARPGERRLNDWLLLVLRFAIAREDDDRARAIASAAELDAGDHPKRSSFTFFQRITCEFCRAIVAVRDERSEIILRNFATHIDDPRLKAAFYGCLDLTATSNNQAAARGRPGVTGKTCGTAC
jgi:hypothetical protein